MDIILLCRNGISPDELNTQLNAIIDEVEHGTES